MRSRRRTTKRIAAFVGGAGIAVAAYAFVGADADEGPGPKRPSADEFSAMQAYAAGDPVLPGIACPGAEIANGLTELRTLTETNIYVPTARAATDFWVCGSTPALGFGDLEVNFEGGWDDVDPHTKWTGLAEQSGGRVETIHGRPAWVRPADESGTWPFVAFIVNGTLVRTLGAPGVSTVEVLELAKSIPAPPEVLHP